MAEGGAGLRRPAAGAGQVQEVAGIPGAAAVGPQPRRPPPRAGSGGIGALSRRQDQGERRPGQASAQAGPAEAPSRWLAAGEPRERAGFSGSGDRRGRIPAARRRRAAGEGRLRRVMGTRSRTGLPNTPHDTLLRRSPRLLRWTPVVTPSGEARLLLQTMAAYSGRGIAQLPRLARIGASFASYEQLLERPYRSKSGCSPSPFRSSHW